jgi:hypothetical protein
MALHGIATPSDLFKPIGFGQSASLDPARPGARFRFGSSRLLLAVGSPFPASTIRTAVAVAGKRTVHSWTFLDPLFSCFLSVPQYKLF